MPIIVGSRVMVGKHVWRVTRVEGNYCYLEWHGHSKVVATRAAEEYMTPGSPGRKSQYYGAPKRPPKKPDAVRQALSECETPDDLMRVAENHYSVLLAPKQIRTLAGLPNFGMQRMYVGGIVRREIAARQQAV